MQIKLGNMILCAGSTRNASGNPIGPDDVTVDEHPGVSLREYVGADRVQGEHVRCDAGMLSFTVTRLYASVAQAAAYALTGHRSEPKAGELSVKAPGAAAFTTLFANAVVESKSISQCGVSVVVKYTLRG